MHGLLGADVPLVGPRQFTADDILSPYVYIFYIAYGVAFLLTPILRTVAIYYGIIDQPDNIRKLHKEPVAYLGGVAVFLGWLAGLALTQALPSHRPTLDLRNHIHINFSIVAGACIIVLLGLWDDVARIKPWMKIGGQVVAAMALLSTGVGTKAAHGLLSLLFGRVRLVAEGGFGDLPPDHWLVLVSSCALVIFIVVVCCNATNLMDGLDGLCGGVTAVIAAGFLFLAVHLAMTSGGRQPNADALRVVLALALLGAVLGFIPYNFNPASIFMGDTGSMFLGYAIAVMMVLMCESNHPKWFLASAVMFALPILDTALAFVRRYVNRRPFFSADRHHLHHQLVARGFTIKQTVMINYGLALAFVLLGAAIVFMRTRFAVGVYLMVFGSIIVTAYKMGMIHERVKPASRKSIAEATPQAALPVEPGAVLELPNQLPATGVLSDELANQPR